MQKKVVNDTYQQNNEPTNLVSSFLFVLLHSLYWEWNV